jgi:NAD(P)-dependent dehydrogenase (short-subunit alcohol dehydrogenase family)
MATEDLRFDGQVAVVTGAGANPGLGRSYALFLASRGAKVVVNDLGVGPDGSGAVGTGVEAVVEEINSNGGEAVGDGHSVAEPESAKEIVGQAIDRWGRVDIVINNAGIAPFGGFDQLADDLISRVVGVHLMGHIWMCRAAWPHMAEQGYGRLVNVSSGVAVMGMANQSIYAASKLGIVGLTRVLAAEGAELGIKANAIMPMASTLALEKLTPPGFNDQIRESGQVPEVVAPVVAYLAHRECSVSGKVIDAKAGAVSEVFFAQTRGTRPNPKLTVEDVRDVFAEAVDRSVFTAFDDYVGDLSQSPEEVVAAASQ